MIAWRQQEVKQRVNEHFALIITKQKAMEDSEIGPRYPGILEHIENKKEMLDLLKIIKLDNTWRPDGIYPRLLGEAEEDKRKSLHSL